MKYYIRFVVVLFSFVAVSTTDVCAQHLSFGVKGGVDVLNMEYKNDVFDKSNRAGFFLGPTLVISTPVPGLSVDVSALYDQRRLKVDEESLKQESLLIPAHARYGVGIPGVGSVFLCGGPQLSFNVGTSKFYWEDLQENGKYFSLQDTKLSFDFGVGVSFAGHLEAAVYYNVPIGKTADFTWNDFSHAASQTMNSTKTTTNAWMISASYIF